MLVIVFWFITVAKQRF